MAHPRVYRAEAVVLKGTDFGEADKVLTLYTASQGKIRVVAKGVRRPGSRLGGHLDLLTHARLLIARGRNLDIVTQAETVESFLGLRDDLWRASQACQVAELLDRMTEEAHEDRALFDTVLEALRRIALDPDPELAVRQFEATLLDRLGYRPQLRECVRCQQPLERVDSYYGVAAGGVLCPDCGPREAASRPLSANGLAFLRRLQTGDYRLLERVRRDEALRREIEDVLRRQIHFVLERDLRSTAFVNRLRAMAISG